MQLRLILGKFLKVSSLVIENSYYFTSLRTFIAINQRKPCLTRKIGNFREMLSDPCLNIAEIVSHSNTNINHAPKLYLKVIYKM